MNKERNILKDVEYDLEELNKFKEKELESKFKPYQKEGSKKGYNSDEDSEWLDIMTDKDVEMRAQDLW